MVCGRIEKLAPGDAPHAATEAGTLKPGKT
jgi:hypothetical protein